MAENTGGDREGADSGRQDGDSGLAKAICGPRIESAIDVFEGAVEDGRMTRLARAALYEAIADALSEARSEGRSEGFEEGHNSPRD